jgi:hypothetical protein
MGKSRLDFVPYLNKAVGHCDTFYRSAECVFQSDIKRMMGSELEIGNVITVSCASKENPDHYLYVVVAVSPVLELSALIQNNIVGLPLVASLLVPSSEYVWAFSSVESSTLKDLRDYSPVAFKSARKEFLDLTTQGSSGSSLLSSSCSSDDFDRLAALFAIKQGAVSSTDSDTYNKATHQPLATMLGSNDKIKTMFKGKVTTQTTHLIYAALPTILHDVHAVVQHDKLKFFLLSAFVPLTSIKLTHGKQGVCNGVTIHDFLSGKTNKINVDELSEAGASCGCTRHFKSRFASEN